MSAYTGCCTFVVSPTIPDKIDPTVVLLQWADQINSVSSGNNSTPFLSKFVNGLVYVKTALSTTATGVALSSTVTVVSAGLGLTAIQVGNKVKVDGYTAYVGSTYVPASTTVPLVNADGTAFIIPATIAALTPIKFYRTTTTATYTPATGASASTVDSCLDIVGAYVDTVFGDCSFDPKDHFEIEPVYIYASAVDSTCDPCSESCFFVA